MPSLHTLGIGCGNVDDAALSTLPRFPSLRELTPITDRSLEILGVMTSLEQIEFYECLGVTDAGLGHLARLPKLREVHVGASPGVTLDGTRVFPPRVRVKYLTVNLRQLCHSSNCRARTAELAAQGVIG